VVEYRDLYEQSITMSSSIFGSAFYTLTGFHTLHVAVGLVVLTVIFTLMATNRLRCPSSGARAAEYYWHFVDVVWIVVFSIVYLGGVM
jgi:heme/copper-type cytochrome/quinol oxidase subunit 3